MLCDETLASSEPGFAVLYLLFGTAYVLHQLMLEEKPFCEKAGQNLKETHMYDQTLGKTSGRE